MNNIPMFVLLSSTTISFAICLFVFSVIPGNHAYSPQLEGTRHRCQSEGKPVAVHGLSYMKCFDCTCKDGFVECLKRKCPKIEGCYQLRELQSGECCQKCKGCMKDNKYYESGTEWVDPESPCRKLTCIAGVITEALIKCYTPCKNPILPKPGQCCPTCPVCRVNNEPIANKTQIMKQIDPCVSCVCSSKELLCMKKTCPVLNCPADKIVQDVNECCPQCLGSSIFLDIREGSCIFDKRIRQSGTQFTLDRCTQCACQNSTLLCKKRSCPVLFCKKEQQQIIPGGCCPYCDYVDYYNESLEKKDKIINENEDKDDIRNKINDKVEYEDEKEVEYEDDEEAETTIIEVPKKHKIVQSKSCIYDGATYKDGETWNTSTCKTCTCFNSRMNCSLIMCRAVHCPPNGMLKIHEGECCPVCEESKNQAVCTVARGTHFRTFDKKEYAFLGSCKYKLASDCDSGTFNIRLKNTVTNNNASIKRISVRLGNVKVDLQKNRKIKVNDEIIDLPYQIKNMLDIKMVDKNVAIHSKIGIEVLWNYVGFLEVTVPNTYRKKLCGLCGNFNSIANDDLTTREAILTEDPTIFAQSWTAGDNICLETKNYEIQSCNPSRNRRLCSYAKGSLFSRCLRKLNVESYYETCLKDMCECPPDDRQCHCKSFASYVHDCERLGILFPRWRKAVGC